MAGVDRDQIPIDYSISKTIPAPRAILTDRRVEPLPKRSRRERIPVTLAERPHPFPSRTRKLSSPAPKILRGQPFGKIGRRRDFLRSAHPRQGGPPAIRRDVRARRDGPAGLDRPVRYPCPHDRGRRPAALLAARDEPRPPTEPGRDLPVSRFGRRQLAEHHGRPRPSLWRGLPAGHPRRREAAAPVPDRRPPRAARPTRPPARPGRSPRTVRRRCPGRSPARLRSSSTTVGSRSPCLRSGPSGCRHRPS